jgi:hypothetical protein
VLEKLESVEAESVVEGLEVPELPPLPRPSPLLAQWAWRSPTTHPPLPEQLTAQYWFQDLSSPQQNAGDCNLMFGLDPDLVGSADPDPGRPKLTPKKGKKLSKESERPWV